MFLRVNTNTYVGNEAPKDTSLLWWDVDSFTTDSVTTSLVVEDNLHTDLTSYMSGEATVEVPNVTTYCKKYNNETKQWEISSTKRCYPITHSGRGYLLNPPAGCPADEHVLVDLQFGGGYSYDVIERAISVSNCTWKIKSFSNTEALLELKQPTGDIVVSFTTHSASEPE